MHLLPEDVDYSPRLILLGLAAGGIVLAVIASLAERRRLRRRDMDKVGWVPWTAVQVVAMAVAAISIAYAVKMH